MKLKYLLLYTFLFIAIGLMLHGCDALKSDSGEEETLISGQVTEKNTGSAVVGAIVEITAPASLRQEFISDSLGNFTFTADIDSAVNVNMEAAKQGFEIAAEFFRLAPGVDVSGLNLALTAEGDKDGDSGGESVGGKSGGAAAIILKGISSQSVNLAESGGVVNSAFRFEVQDSAGRAVDQDKAVNVNFTIVSGPNGGESLTPAVVRTNANGQATSNFFAGNASGVVKIQALATRADIDLTIRSKPITVAVHGGFPELDHFSLAPGKYNFEGYDFNNIRNPITVIVGDKFSNPVKPGTPVYFKSTGGVIQGSGTTDDDGIVVVDLISGDPRPNDSIPGSDGRPGYATVTAMTKNENDVDIEKSINLIFSTSNALISATPTTFDLQANGGTSFDYTVTDLNGNPMAAGTQISVEAGEGMEVTGAVNFTLGNYLFPGPQATDFRFSIRDTDEESNDPADLTIKILVTSPSGKTTVYDEIQGTRRKITKR